MFWQTWPAVDLKKVLSVTKHGFVLWAQPGAPNGKFWEKTWKQQQRFTKAFWYHVKQFGILLVKIHLFLTPSTDWWKSSQPARCTYNLQPDFLGSFPADVCRDITRHFMASLGVVTGQNSALQWGEVGGGGIRKVIGVVKGRNLTPWVGGGEFLTPNPLRHPEMSISHQHFPSKDILIFLNLPASKILPEEQIFWGTDPLGAPPCSVNRRLNLRSIKCLRIAWLFLINIW